MTILARCAHSATLQASRQSCAARDRADKPKEVSKEAYPAADSP
jgi:hypothetical protein